MNNKLQLIALIVPAILSSGCGGQQEKNVSTPAPQPMEQAEVLMLSGREIQLAGVTIGSATTDRRSSRRRAAGVLVNASQTETTLTPRYSGRIVRLHRDRIGQPIRVGDPVAEIYSPELSALMAEHLLLLKPTELTSGINEETQQLVTASTQKLKRAGMTAAQITALEQSGKAPASITWQAEFAGTVQEILVQEGTWVTAGTAALTLRSNRSLLVETGVYADEQPSVGSGMPIMFSGGLNTRGTIESILPDTGADALTITIRLRAERLPADAREGDPATVIIDKPDAMQLWVPDAAVARSGEQAGVFVVAGPGAFRLQRVQAGESADGRTMILSGLSPGDSLALSGAWLLHAELSNRRGVRPLSEMKNQP